MRPDDTTTSSPEPAFDDGTTHSDPFLSQGRDIPLTERDRQEGYDLDLVHAQPRGIPPSSNNSSVAAAAHNPYTEQYYRRADEHDPALYRPVSNGSPSAADGVGTGGGGYFASRSTNEKDFGRGKGGLGEGNIDALAGHGPRRRQWYLSRRAIVSAVALLLVVIALAVGLGVGLGKKNHHHNGPAAVQSPYGTVIPSSLGSLSSTVRHSTTTRASTSLTRVATTAASTTSTRPVASATLTTTSAVSVVVTTVSVSAVSTGVVTTSTRTLAVAGATSTALTTIDSATLHASTGNRPVPVGSSTVINGTLTISALSADALYAQSATATLLSRRKKRSRP